MRDAAAQDFGVFSEALKTPGWSVDAPRRRDDLAIIWRDGRESHPCVGDESPQAWAARLAITPERMALLASSLAAVNGDLYLWSKSAALLRRDGAGSRFLVQGLIPRGKIEVLLGNTKIGKGAGALQLCVAISRVHSHVFGLLIPEDVRGSPTVFISGEDPRE